MTTLRDNIRNMFSEFEPVTPEEWKDKIVKDLKGGRYDDIMRWQTPDGTVMEPFYTEEDFEEIPGLEIWENQVPKPPHPSYGARYWSTMEKIPVTNDLEEANAMALHALRTGVDNICFELSKALDTKAWKNLLNEIQPAHCRISISGKVTESQLNAFSNALHELGHESVSGEVYLQNHPLEEEIGLYKTLEAHPQIRMVAFRAVAKDNLAGSLAEVLQVFCRALEASINKGITAETFFKKSGIELALTNDYFREIARFRALRMLIAGMAIQYGVDLTPEQVFLVATTTIEHSDRTKDDPYLNMLSNTHQSLSGILGGCNVMHITPYNKGLEEVDEFSRRMSRNISNLLREESYLNKVADPAAGSYYISALTDVMAQKAWETWQNTSA